MDAVILISSILLWVVVLFNLLITFRLIQIVAPDVWAENAPKLKTGQSAPMFQIETEEGKKVSLSFFKDRPVFLIFISLQCPTCLKKIPDIQSVAPLANEAGLHLALICDVDQTKTRAFAREFGITTPIFSAPRENPIWKKYKVNGTPFYCLIDNQAKVLDTGVLDSNLETMAKIWKINALSVDL